MRALGFTLLTSVVIFCSSCASLSGSQAQYLVCPYDTVWEAAVETMKNRPITIQDMGHGLIETGWIEMAALERPYGIFGRDAFDNKERARMTLSVMRMNDVTAVSLVENRQRWHLRGGVTQQATKWWSVEPSQEALNEVMHRLDAKLKEHGCSPA